VPDAAEIRDRLRRAGERALEELLAAGETS